MDGTSDGQNAATTVWTRLEPWQLTQICRLAKYDPERVETIFNTIWAMYPNLRWDLAIGAVEQSELTVEEAAEHFQVPVGEIEKRLEAHCRALSEWGQAEILETERGAKVEDTQVCVWEIIREYRKIGSMEALRESFPGLSTAQLGAAINYAREHPAEIESLISAYEEVQARKREEYPFA